MLICWNPLTLLPKSACLKNVPALIRFLERNLAPNTLGSRPATTNVVPTISTSLLLAGILLRRRNTLLAPSAHHATMNIRSTLQNIPPCVVSILPTSNFLPVHLHHPPFQPVRLRIMRSVVRRAVRSMVRSVMRRIVSHILSSSGSCTGPTLGAHVHLSVLPRTVHYTLVNTTFICTWNLPNLSRRGGCGRTCVGTCVDR